MTQGPRPKTVTHPPLRTLIEGWLDRAKAGEVDAWWRLNRDMTLTEDSDYYPFGAELQPDLTALPGWQALDEGGRSRLVEAAFHYVQVGDPADAEWLGKNLFHRPAAAGYRALRLLLKAGQQRLDMLDPDVWDKWAASILNYSGHHSDGDDKLGLELVALAYRKTPNMLLRALDALIDKENRENRTVFVMTKLAKAWDGDLARAILRKVEDETLEPGTVGILVHEVLSRFPQVAEPVARGLLRRRSDAPPHPSRAQLAAVALLEETPRDAWEEVWPALRDDRGFGRAVVEALASRSGLSETPTLVADLDEQALADLYVWLRREFPDERHLGVGAVGTGELVIALRDAILQSLKRRGTDEAVRPWTAE